MAERIDGSVKRKKIGRPPLEESERRRRKVSADSRRGKTRIALGDAINRWNELKTEKDISSHHDMAEFLLDRYYNSVENKAGGEHISKDCNDYMKYKEDGSCLEASFTRPEHNSDFMTKLFELWKEQKICDATISLGDKKVPIHKLVLLINCPFAMEYYGQQNTSSLDIKLPAYIEESAVKDFVKYLYTGRLKITAKNIASMKKVGKLLQIKDVVEYCKIFREAKLPLSSRKNNQEKSDADKDYQPPESFYKKNRISEDNPPCFEETIIKQEPVDMDFNESCDMSRVSDNLCESPPPGSMSCVSEQCESPPSESPSEMYICDREEQVQSVMLNCKGDDNSANNLENEPRKPPSPSDLKIAIKAEPESSDDLTDSGEPPVPPLYVDPVSSKRNGQNITKRLVPSPPKKGDFLADTLKRLPNC